MNALSMIFTRRKSAKLSYFQIKHNPCEMLLLMISNDEYIKMPLRVSLWEINIHWMNITEQFILSRCISSYDLSSSSTVIKHVHHMKYLSLTLCVNQWYHESFHNYNIFPVRVVVEAIDQWHWHELTKSVLCFTES